MCRLMIRFLCEGETCSNQQNKCGVATDLWEFHFCCGSLAGLDGVRPVASRCGSVSGVAICYGCCAFFSWNADDRGRKHGPPKTNSKNWGSISQLSNLPTLCSFWIPKWWEHREILWPRGVGQCFTVPQEWGGRTTSCTSCLRSIHANPIHDLLQITLTYFKVIPILGIRNS